MDGYGCVFFGFGVDGDDDDDDDGSNIGNVLVIDAYPIATGFDICRFSNELVLLTSLGLGSWDKKVWSRKRGGL